MRRITRRQAILTLGALLAGTGVAGGLAGCAGKPACSLEARALTATSEQLDNPRRGWTRLAGFSLSDDEADLSELDGLPTDVRLLVVEVNLRAFRDVELTQAALDQVDTILATCARQGRALIVRYLYDWDGDAEQAEPEDLALIERHMAQLGPVTSEHASDILCLQGLFVGDYGEMHDSAHVDAQSMVELAGTLAQAMDPAIPLCVRTPAQLRAIVAASPELEGRFGLFNDGILGSATDLGTYASEDAREEELDYQSELCQTVPNGGEAIAGGIDGQLEQLSSLARMCLTYLSREYDGTLLGLWRTRRFEARPYADLFMARPAAEAVTADARAFDGATLFSFVEAHLGYRLMPTGCELLRPPSLPERLASLGRDGSSEADALVGEAEAGNVTVGVTIANVGWACAYHALAARLAFVPTGDASEDARTLNIDIEAAALGSLQTGERCELAFGISSSSLASGTYDLRLTVFDQAAGESGKTRIALACAGGLDADGLSVGTLAVG